jgi:Coenzyme PQQ synthesis protein D (PqqD)
MPVVHAPAMAPRYRVNGPNVVHETVEREAIVIHLEHGTYYSLAEASACVWDAVVRGGGEADALAAVMAAYDVAPETARPAVAELLTALVAEGLVAVDDDVPALPLPVATPAEAARRPWIAPTLGRFTDMQDLLLADPIHEVAEAGWPHVKPVAR